MVKQYLRNTCGNSGFTAGRMNGFFMLRKLRVKFVAICMTFVTILLIALFVTAFVSARKNMEQITDGVLQRVMRETPTRNTPDIGLGEVVLPYFTVNIWEYTVYVTGGTYAGLEDTFCPTVCKKMRMKESFRRTVCAICGRTRGCICG